MIHKTFICNGTGNGERESKETPNRYYDRGESSAFLVPFFNVFYYLAITPFYTELDQNGKYILKAHVAQQVRRLKIDFVTMTGFD